MERIIRVTGKGRILVKPDTIRLIFTIEGLKKEYDDAVEMSAKMTSKIKDIFEKLGFSREDLKTQYFNVAAEYENYNTPDKGWEKRFEGYKFTHRLKIEFHADNKMLGKVLYEVGHSEVKPEFDIEYTVADSEKSKNELLGNAVSDAEKKAEVLAKAANVSLGSILNIDYSCTEKDFVSRPMEKMMSAGASMIRGAAYNIDVTPEDIDVSDTVTVVWEIIKN